MVWVQGSLSAARGPGFYLLLPAWVGITEEDSETPVLVFKTFESEAFSKVYVWIYYLGFLYFVYVWNFQYQKNCRNSTKSKKDHEALNKIAQFPAFLFSTQNEIKRLYDHLIKSKTALQQSLNEISGQSIGDQLQVINHSNSYQCHLESQSPRHPLCTHWASEPLPFESRVEAWVRQQNGKDWYWVLKISLRHMH